MSKSGCRRRAVAAAFIPAAIPPMIKTRVIRPAPYLPCLAQCDPKIASGVMVLGARGRETQVRLTKCRALTFSVVILPPQVPQASDNV